MPAPPLRSIPEVCDVDLVHGAKTSAAAPLLLLEVAHGASRAVHFQALRAALRGAYPDDLIDFFFVNTDVGAPEVARRTAERVVAARGDLSALVVRSLIPRTFVDCNRIIDCSDGSDRKDAPAKPGEALTPGLHAYVVDPQDRQLLLGRHRAYCDLVDAAFAQVCDAGGCALMVHTYAPRSIDVPVDEHIVARLRAEYAPDRIATWPLRPQVDLIARDPDGRTLASAALLASAQAAFARAGLTVAVNGTYPLHPVTQAHRLAARHPERTLCLELRRDLLVREFTPFAEMDPDPLKVDRAAAAMAEAVLAALPAPHDDDAPARRT